jgi:hypothetical protein
MTPPTERALHLLGGLFAVAGVVFVGIQLVEQGRALESVLLERELLELTALCAFFYAMANFPLAMAWTNLLQHFGSLAQPLVALAVYGLTLPAKYIPGNIIQFAGRQALGIARGIDGWVLAKASIYEILLICCAGLLCSIFILTEFIPALTPGSTVALFMVCCFCFAFGVDRWLSRRALFAILLQLLFLLCSAATFVAILIHLTGATGMAFVESLVVAGAFMLAWTIGLVTPGAPAGAGVREIVLLACLNGMVEETELLAAVVASRFVTVAGDMIFFGLITLMSMRSTRGRPARGQGTASHRGREASSATDHPKG